MSGFPTIPVFPRGMSVFVFQDITWGAVRVFASFEDAATHGERMRGGNGTWKRQWNTKWTRGEYQEITQLVVE